METAIRKLGNSAALAAGLNRMRAQWHYLKLLASAVLRSNTICYCIIDGDSSFRGKADAYDYERAAEAPLHASNKPGEQGTRLIDELCSGRAIGLTGSMTYASDDAFARFMQNCAAEREFWRCRPRRRDGYNEGHMSSGYAFFGAVFGA